MITHYYSDIYNYVKYIPNSHTDINLIVEVLMQLKISRVLYEFDIPQVIELMDDCNHIYIGIYASSNEAGDEYCVIRINHTTLNELYSGKIDLHSIFSSPDDGYSLRLLINSDDEWHTPSEVHDFHHHENVVKVGFFLNLS